jgi:hypothetical protein
MYVRNVMRGTCCRYLSKHNVLQNSRSWSGKEDERLRRLVAHSRVNHLIPWSKVSYYMDK